MKLYHKIFKRRSDLSIYLDNPDQLVAYAEEMLNRLTHAKSVDELHKAKLSVLKDFCDIYAFISSVKDNNVHFFFKFMYRTCETWLRDKQSFC